MSKGQGPFIGIDLGTTNSVVSYIDPHGRPVCLPNSDGDILTPSVVFFEEAGPAVVGREAIRAGLQDPEFSVECVKRDMGKEVYHSPIRGKYLPPAAISGVILHRLIEDASMRLGKFKRSVVTVPAYFNEPRRKATMDAARMAGLEEVELLNEPTAGALAFGYEIGVFTDKGDLSNIPTKVSGQYTILVYDLGGGTFDVTLMRIKDRHFQALVCDGDVQLGGKDWDERIVRYACECFAREFDIDLSQDARAMKRLWLDSEEVKRALSQRTKAALRIEQGANRIAIELTRKDLDHLTGDLLGRTRLTCELAMMEAKLEWKELDCVLLVGGSSRMPMVRDMLIELGGVEPYRTVSPDEAVAQGAALYAQMLWGEAADGGVKEGIRKRKDAARITNINSHSLGIVGRSKSGDRKVSVLIPKNTPLPHSNSKVFKTRAKGQSKIYIQVVEGESTDPGECALIGECRLVGLPKNLPEGWPVSVTFAYRRDGRIFLEAQVKGAEPFHVEIDRNQKISDEEAEQWANELIGDVWDEDAEEEPSERKSKSSALLPSKIKTHQVEKKQKRPPVRRLPPPASKGPEEEVMVIDDDDE